MKNINIKMLFVKMLWAFSAMLLSVKIMAYPYNEQSIYIYPQIKTNDILTNNGLLYKSSAENGIINNNLLNENNIDIYEIPDFMKTNRFFNHKFGELDVYPVEQEDLLYGPVGPPINGLPEKDSYITIIIIAIAYGIYKRFR